MSAQAQHITHWTMEEYLAFENHVNARHEYFQGGIYAMAGATIRHNTISLNATSSLRAQLRGKPCAARIADVRLRIDEADLTTYPDIMVNCPPEKVSASDPTALTDATVIIEVLSPSTAQYDKTSKFKFYCYLPSFQHYLLVEQNRVHVEHRARQADGSWKTETFTHLDDVIELRAISCQLALRDIYEEIIF